MKQVNFKDIDLLAWGNDITIAGVVMQGKEEDSYLVMLPMEKFASYGKPDLSVITPTSEEWYALQDQLDKHMVRGSEAGVLLRKGQRVLDQKICWKVYRRDKFKCRYCGIDNVPLTVDHIITWESGGATHEDNLLTSCRKCNKKRGNMDYGSWLQHKYYFEKSQFLTEKERKMNEDIVAKLLSLPKVSVMRSR